MERWSFTGLRDRPDDELGRASMIYSTQVCPIDWLPINDVSIDTFARIVFESWFYLWSLKPNRE